MEIVICNLSMKAAIYNPYLDTLGGGERYSLAFAKVLADSGYLVDLEWSDESIKLSLEKRFGIDLKNINVTPDIKKGEGYDVCFWVSDGSIPLMHARNNILHFQVPFHKVNGKSLFNKMKFFRINKFVCNSQFTKSVIDKEFGIESIVLYPPVDTKNIKPKRKENIILYVGRFSKILQGKGQEFLLTAFKKMYDNGLKDWKLVLAGGTEIGADIFLQELEENSKNYPVVIIKSPDFKMLKDLYGKSKIFWSASGFGHNENENPEKMEHFGITVVEAMSAGAVPIVFNGGGHKEIIDDCVNGYLWDNPEDLIEKTLQLIANNKTYRLLESEAKKKADTYSILRFEKELLSTILQK